MTTNLLEFIAIGSPRAVSSAIEQYATGQGSVSAIVVPWESDAATVSLAVTSATGEGWAIEHTNLGTIRLTDLGQDRTRVTIAPETPDRPDAPELVRFARHVQNRFQAAS